MGITADFWQPSSQARARVDEFIQIYRQNVTETLQPIVRAYYPSLLNNANNEYRKMIELSTKMTVVGHACTELAGYRFDARRQKIAGLFGCCCFLADSFIDDFGEAATRDYLDRLERLLSQGWFAARNDREKLFYVVIARLFAERNILDPTLRQAIWRQFEAQKRDVELRLGDETFDGLSHRQRLLQLKQCARDRSGHAILVLAAFLVPKMSFGYRAHMFAAGALIMHIDDHGDCYADLRDHRITFMNQVKNPERALYRVFLSSVGRLFRNLPAGSGRDLLLAFLTRYYLTRVDKHRQQKAQGGYSWATYE